MALELIIKKGDNYTPKVSCNSCHKKWEDSVPSQSTICPFCLSPDITRADAMSYKHGDIVTLDYSPSPWSDAEKRTVVYLPDSEVEALLKNLDLESETDLWNCLDGEKIADGKIVARRAFKVACPFENTDGNFIEITAEDIVKK